MKASIALQMGMHHNDNLMSCLSYIEKESILHVRDNNVLDLRPQMMMKGF